jgi:peptidoglycan hydrolase-like protein with peptidoglycan-binding domain
VNRAKLIISVCVVLVSGCSLFDSAETDPEKSLVTPPVPASESLPVEVVAEKPAHEAPRMPPRALTRDEVRQLQVRLKNAGFDPGPVDGVVGTRTKAAFNRYHAGCAKVKLALNDFDDTGAPATVDNSLSKKTLGRQEIQAIQNQLRAAGFDPGPADGIFGPKTKRAVAHLKANCPTMNEFAAALNESVSGPDNKNVVGQAAAPSDRFTKAHSPTTPTPITVTQRAATATPARTSEEIRVLQLRLRDAGFDPGAFDGVMGPKTKSALQQYEASQRGKKIKTSLTTEISGQY